MLTLWPVRYGLQQLRCQLELPDRIQVYILGETLLKGEQGLEGTKGETGEKNLCINNSLYSNCGMIVSHQNRRIPGQQAEALTQLLVHMRTDVFVQSFINLISEDLLQTRCCIQHSDNMTKPKPPLREYVKGLLGACVGCSVEEEKGTHGASETEKYYQTRKQLTTLLEYYLNSNQVGKEGFFYTDSGTIEFTHLRECLIPTNNKFQIGERLEPKSKRSKYVVFVKSKNRGLKGDLGPQGPPGPKGEKDALENRENRADKIDQNGSAVSTVYTKFILDLVNVVYVQIPELNPYDNIRFL
ncbi:hypothetical protein ACRRTK_021852 [Alexandromys fortis]